MTKRLLSGRLSKRVISALLAVAMSFSVLSVGTYADDEQYPSETNETVTIGDESTDTAEATENTEETTIPASEETVPSSSETTIEPEPEPEPMPTYILPITANIMSETDTSVTLSGTNLPEAVTYRIISNGMTVAETYSIENYIYSGLMQGSYYEFYIEAYNIDGSLIGRSEPVFGYTDLSVTSNYSLSRDMVVSDLTINSGSSGTFNLNGYALNVMGNANINSGTLYINSGSLYIDGNANFGYTSNNSNVYLNMTNANDYMLVKGNFYFRSYYNQSGYLTAGTLEVKGNFTQRSSSNNAGFYASGTHTTILSGEGLQKVNFDNTSARFNTLELRNFSFDGVVLETTVTRNDLITNGCNILVYNGERSGWKLTGDEVIDGDVYLTSGTLDLNGYTLTINGNLIQSGGTVKINAGNLIISGDYRIQSNTNGVYGNSVGILNMTNTADVVSVGGSFITQSTVSHNGYLTAGTLEVSGNLRQVYGTQYNFYTSGTHTTVLNGDTAQSVNIYNSHDSQSHLNNLKIENTSETGVTFATQVYVLGKLYNTESKLTNLKNLYTYTNTSFPDDEWSHDLYLNNNFTLKSDLHIIGNLYLQNGTLTIN
jgi:hypothetical protein